MPAKLTDYSGKIYKIIFIIVFDSPETSGSSMFLNFLDFIKYLYNKFLSNPENNLKNLERLKYDC